MTLARQASCHKSSERDYPVTPPPGIPPHVIFFLLYNLLYLLPLLFAFLLDYEEGGVAAALNVSGDVLLKVCYVYGVGACSFFAGSGALRFLTWSKYGRCFPPQSFPLLQIGFPEWIAIGTLLVVFIVSKVALIPSGVYHEYAFDSGSMTGGLWSFSTFCSEAMILAALLPLFSSSKYGLRAFLIISGINAINLLHGTRLFFISSAMALILFAYIKRKLTFKVLLLYGPIAGSAMLLLAYLTFLSRSAINPAGSFTAAKLLSPIMYESVFSQMSLLSVIKNPEMWGGFPNAIWFVHDLFLFVSPRFVMPEKDASLFIGQYAWVSPLGAFNGYAQGLVYFGLLFPTFYFFLGLLGTWLYRRAQANPWWFVFYALFTEDFLLHLMRDGYLIPLKMLINSATLLCLFVVSRFVLLACRPSLGELVKSA